MTSRKPSLTVRLAGMLAASVMLALPGASHGLGLGEITLQSRLGEPLRAQVSLFAASNERVDDSCLALLPPEASGDRSGYLLRANLSIKTKGEQQYISIASSSPLNDVFARLRLQVKCPGIGSLVKTFTVLPDPGSISPQEPETGAALPSASSPAAAPAEKQGEPQAAAESAHAQTASPERKKPAERKPPKTSRERHRAPTTKSAEKRQEVFRLKLSGDPIDASRIGKISPEERAALLAQKKLLDADDQTASFLALQHQVKLLQDELGAIKLQLAQLGASSVPTTAAIPQPAAVTDSTQTSPQPAVKRPAIQQSNVYLQNGLFAVLGLLAILLLWQGLRRYTKAKSRMGLDIFKEAEPLPVQSMPVVSEPTPPAPKVETKPQITPAPLPPSAPAAAAPAPPAPPLEADVREEDAMLDEAKLYASHGRPAKAVEILQDLVTRWPAKDDAWLLLLSVLSSLGDAAEFGIAAREFSKHHPDSPSWNMIQALGRTLEPDEPLYENQQATVARLLSANAAEPRRQIGDILMGMGALSRQDLQNCLEDYNPEKHGRFGGYLVTRKAITLAQLDQALLRQQGITPEMQQQKLPSLQDVENLLADFDPKRNGSVAEFLASREAEVAKQSNETPPQATPDNSPRNTAQPLFRKDEVLDFVLETSAEQPALDLEFDSPSGDDQSLDFEVSAPSPSSSDVKPLDFPEIQLDFGNDERTGEETEKR